jgi:hypothetical protein
MMSWFISPWEAARLSLEAQRVMAFHFLRFASGQERPIQEVCAGGQTLMPPLLDRSVVASVEPAIRAKSIVAGGSKTVPVRKTMGVIRKPINVRKVKDKKANRKGKKPI